MIFVAVLSCQQERNRQQQCRQTWLPVLRQMPEVLAQFIVGGPAANAGDTLYLPVDDGRNLTAKVRAAVRAAISLGATQFFKCDDDTFVHPQRLIRLAEDADITRCDYVGRSGPAFWKRIKFGTGGAGYLLSLRAMEIVANMPDGPDQLWHEDVNVGESLFAAGVRLVNDCRLYWSFQPEMWPGPGNLQVTSHTMHKGSDMKDAFCRMHNSLR